MDNRKWILENGQWKMDNGKWEMENLWTVSSLLILGVAPTQVIPAGTLPLCAEICQPICAATWVFWKIWKIKIIKNNFKNSGPFVFFLIFGWAFWGIE